MTIQQKTPDPVKQDVYWPTYLIGPRFAGAARSAISDQACMSPTHRDRSDLLGDAARTSHINSRIYLNVFHLALSNEAKSNPA